jgi:putative DNA primase/helicase
MTGLAMETLIVTHGEQHPTDVASLRGMRLAVAVETEEGRRLAEAKVKQLTGGDRLRARFMRQDFFEFDPTHKLLIVGNHKPRLANIDEAIRRRILMVPFVAAIPEDKRDKDLSEKLRAEAGGILRWAIEGCLEWQRRGLDPPESVRKASAAYFEEQDAFAEWKEERLVLHPKVTATKGSVFENWKSWTEARGEMTHSSKWLHEQIARLDGVSEGRNTKGERAWMGLGLKVFGDAEEKDREPDFAS